MAPVEGRFLVCFVIARELPVSSNLIVPPVISDSSGSVLQVGDFSHDLSRRSRVKRRN